MGVIFALSHRSELPDVGGLPSPVTAVAGHLGAYAVLAALLWWGLPGFRARRRLVVAFVIAVAYGVTDEWHQSFVPGRHPDVLDVLTDAVGAAAGLAVVVWLDRRRTGRSRHTRDVGAGDDDVTDEQGPAGRATRRR